MKQAVLGLKPIGAGMPRSRISIVHMQTARPLARIGIVPTLTVKGPSRSLGSRYTAVIPVVLL